jgi:hypothetical protein
LGPGGWTRGAIIDVHVLSLLHCEGRNSVGSSSRVLRSIGSNRSYASGSTTSSNFAEVDSMTMDELRNEKSHVQHQLESLNRILGIGNEQYVGEECK